MVDFTVVQQLSASAKMMDASSKMFVTRLETANTAKNQSI